LPYKHSTSNLLGEYGASTPFSYKGAWDTADLVDILLKNGHVIIPDYQTIVNNQVTGYWGWESTTRGDDRLQFKWNDSSYLSDFDAYEYDYWLD
jgi:hypothetical protein